LRTLGLFLLALQVPGTGTPESATGQDLLQLVARSSPVSKIVLGVLILFSVTSWAIILYKLWTLSRAERQSSAFLDVFRRSSKFSEVQAVCPSLPSSPLVGVFLAGYGVVRAIGELFRQPDAHIGFLGFGTTMGQWLSVPLLIAGLWLIGRAGRDSAKG